jgi:hypothetical protein
MHSNGFDSLVNMSIHKAVTYRRYARERRTVGRVGSATASLRPWSYTSFQASLSRWSDGVQGRGASGRLVSTCQHLSMHMPANYGATAEGRHVSSP